MGVGMKSLAYLTGIALLAIGLSGPAQAFCAGDTTNVPDKPIKARTWDKSGYFTVDGHAVLTISGAHFGNGGTAQLRASFPGHCRQRTGSTISCTVDVDGTRKVKMHVYNPNGRKVYYDWLCYGN